MNDASELSFPVLVVDDETLIRMHAVSAIEDAGYTVYEAVDADHAIAIIEKHPDIRVMFTDVNMPGSMDGIMLAHYVRNRWPPIVIIVTSVSPKSRWINCRPGATSSPSLIEPTAFCGPYATRQTAAARKHRATNRFLKTVSAISAVLTPSPISLTC